MNFFDIGLSEILLILIVALIAFGPGRLPEIARKLGKGVRTIKEATRDVTSEVTKEFNELEINQKHDKSPSSNEDQVLDSDNTSQGGQQ